MSLNQKWSKLGLIFCPTGDSGWMRSHAAVPVPKHLTDDIYRIYFSSRDLQGRSNVGWLDIDIKSPLKVLDLSAHPVLSPGELGGFDDSGTMLSDIAFHQGTEYWYYIGWNLGVTVPFRNAIGLAMFTSESTLIKRYRGPILDRSKDDPHFKASSFVMFSEGKWKMWYLSCEGWEESGDQPKHKYTIRYAESKDGINWVPHPGIAIGFKDESEYAISRPIVIFENDTYHMWYSYRGDRYRIGYAQSPDGINWKRQDHLVELDVSNDGWDSESVEYPYVFDHKGERYMLYNGNEYGKSGFGIAVLESK